MLKMKIGSQIDMLFLHFPCRSVNIFRAFPASWGASRICSAAFRPDLYTELQSKQSRRRREAGAAAEKLCHSAFRDLCDRGLRLRNLMPQTEADRNGVVDLLHNRVVKDVPFFPSACAYQWCESVPAKPLNPSPNHSGRHIRQYAWEGALS